MNTMWIVSLQGQPHGSACAPASAPSAQQAATDSSDSSAHTSASLKSWDIFL